MIALSWSGGKDSARALSQLRDDGRAPQLLLSTVDETTGEVSHHGVSRELLHAQADAARLPLVEIAIPREAPNEVYAERMRAAFATRPLREVGAVAFGDLFLEDLRAFREERLAAIGVDALFPIWRRGTAQLAREIATGGEYDAIVVSVDPAALGRDWLGRRYDASFLLDLPPTVDPCGERGEFHTFVTACPGFGHTIGVALGAQVAERGFPRQRLVLSARGGPAHPQEGCVAGGRLPMMSPCSARSPT